MHKLSLLLASAGMVVIGSAALADSPAPAPAPAAAPTAAAPEQQADRDRVVCRTEAPATGTRLGARRICRTQHEWDDIRQQSQQQTMGMERNNTINPSGQ